MVNPLENEVEELARGRIGPVGVAKIIRTGCCRASLSSCRSNAARVRSFLRGGIKSRGGKRSPPGKDSSSTSRDTSPIPAPGPSSVSNLSSFASGPSSRAKPAARLSGR